jgi:hypothetical protein
MQVSTNGGIDPMESYDGAALYFLSGDWIVRAAGEGRKETRLVNATTFYVVRDGLYFTIGYRNNNRVGALGPDGGVWFFDFRTATSRRLLKSDKLWWSWIGVSPDQRWLLYTQLDGQPGSDLMLVENFR